MKLAVLLGAAAGLREFLGESGQAAIAGNEMSEHAGEVVFVPCRILCRGGPRLTGPAKAFRHHPFGLQVPHQRTGVDFVKDAKGSVTTMVQHWTEMDRYFARKK